MTDHKFTDEEIIKAMKHCNLEVNGLCKECPLHDYSSCTEIICDYALALINRQKAKIKALQMDNEQLQSDIVNANMNLEHIQYEYELLKQEKSVVIAEAIKEFAKRLVAIYENNKCYDRPNAHTLVMTLFCNIDNLVKEMTEGKNESQSTKTVAGVIHARSGEA